MTPKERYTGIQSVFINAGESACLFFCLLSIAEEIKKEELDFIYCYNIAISRGYIDKEFYIKNHEALLQDLTGKKIKKITTKQLPKVIPDNMYSVEKWYNPRTKYTHFKRRGFDTLDKSITVKEGVISEYYLYTMEV